MRLRNALFVLATAALCFTAAISLHPLTVHAQGQKSADDRRFEEIMAKRARGEDVSADERQFAQGVMARRKEQQAKRLAEYVSTHAPKDSTGMVPLPDLGKGTYKGETGGLYPGGENTPPAAHRKAGLAASAKIAPIDGKIVLLSLGMSNTTMEFTAFQKLAAQETGLNPNLVIVDGAQGGQTAAVTANPNANYWKVNDERLSKAGVTSKQVQAVWLKQANAGPTRDFPAEAKKLEEDIVKTLHNLHDKFPNLKIVYFSNRIYAGYAASPLNPEPHAYETAFAVKWIIARQINGDADLSYDKMPWLAWGPYLWSDGLKGRKDGFSYTRDDLGPDGTHPSDSGRIKVAKQLLDFLKSDPTSKPWFLKN
jgi:hypothetical protein